MFSTMDQNLNRKYNNRVLTPEQGFEMLILRTQQNQVIVYGTWMLKLVLSVGERHTSLEVQ